MTARASAVDVDERARRWTVRAPLDETQAVELAAWLDADPRHRGAYVRAQAAWQVLGHDHASTGRSDEAIEPHVAQQHHAGVARDEADREPRASTRRRWLAAAAAIGFVAIAGAWSSAGWLGDDTVAPVRYATGGADVREIVLEDGSHAVLNADTVIDVAFRPTRRSVRLLCGEAWFSVAHDRARPFVVEAGQARAEAVGTAFAVRQDPSGTAVSVTEGVVRVSSNHEIPTLVRKRERATLDAQGGTLTIVSGADNDRALAWRFGQLAFDGETLGEAAAQINRYNRRTLTVDGRELAAERVSGLFDMREPDRFARAAATMFDARVVAGQGDAIVLRRH